jgi:hypothetical protein
VQPSRRGDTRGAGADHHDFNVARRHDGLALSPAARSASRFDSSPSNYNK